MLEPLPLLVDGVWMAPVRAGDERRAGDLGAQVHGTLEAVRGAVAETLFLRGISPWCYERQLAATLRQTSYIAAFSRMVALQPARLDALPAWWRRNARGERVEIASRLLLEEPRHESRGLWRISGSFRSPWRPRSLPVELWLWPHLGTWTKLALEPQRAVHVGRRYFSTGQRALDVLCNRLSRELDAD
ncbi:MAG TPA: hypothetical protein VIJ48_03885 [Acidimicrobiia bacterium]